MISPIRVNPRAGFRPAAQSGMAFVATMMILFFVMTIMLIGIVAYHSGNNGAGLMGTVNNGLRSSDDRLNSAAAFDLAESGVAYTTEWLSEQPSPPDPFNGTSFSPWDTNSSWQALPASSSATSRAVVNYGAGSFSVMVYPDNANYNGQADKCYLIESEGTSSGSTAIVQAYVQQTNFGHYAYFTNYDPSDGWWVDGLNSFDGPMHSNDLNGTVPTNILWYSNKTVNPPMYTYLGPDAYTVSASTINWNQNNIGTAGSPTTAANWANIASGGSSEVVTGTPVIPMPTTTTPFATEVLNGASTPSAGGVTIPSSNGDTTGGIYINTYSGSSTIDQMTLSVTGNTTQVITIQQTDPALTGSNKNAVTTITINQSADTTTVSTVLGAGGPGNTSSATYTGLTNGLVYVNGNIGDSAGSSSATLGLSGTVADNYSSSNGVTNYWGLTIATAPNDDTNIDGSIQYNTPPTSANFSTNAGTFGLVSNQIDVTQKTASGGNNNNVNIDGAVMATDSSDTGTFQAANYGETPTGTFTLYGSYIADQAGVFGEVNLSGTLLAGLAETYDYDSRLSNRPPPYFPTTGNTYTLISWKQVNATLQ